MYTYNCADCGRRFDVRQSFSDDALTICDVCGGKLRKEFGSVGVVFKGSGFYRNDSRSERSGSVSGNSKSESGKSESSKSESGKSESSKSESSKSDSSSSASGSSASSTKSTGSSTGSSSAAS